MKNEDQEVETEITNPSAFPVSVNGDEKAGWLPEVMQEGMTLRDYFAAKAMQGSIMNPACEHWSYDSHAEVAYTAADAMLKARLK